MCLPICGAIESTALYCTVPPDPLWCHHVGCRAPHTPSVHTKARLFLIADTTAGGAQPQESERTCNGHATAASLFSGLLIARLKPPQPTGRPTRRSGQLVVPHATGAPGHRVGGASVIGWQPGPPLHVFHNPRRPPKGADKGAWGGVAGGRDTASRQPLRFVAADPPPSLTRAPAHGAAGSDAGGGRPATALGCRRGKGGGGGYRGSAPPPTRQRCVFLPPRLPRHPLTRRLLFSGCPQAPVPHPRWHGGTPRTPPATHAHTTRPCPASLVIHVSPSHGIAPRSPPPPPPPTAATPPSPPPVYGSLGRAAGPAQRRGGRYNATAAKGPARGAARRVDSSPAGVVGPAVACAKIPLCGSPAPIRTPPP